MTHMKRKLTLLLMCLLLLGGSAMASSEEITTEAEASEEISEESEAEAPPKEEPVGTSPEARDYINYYRVFYSKVRTKTEKCVFLSSAARITYNSVLSTGPKLLHVTTKTSSARLT